MIKKLNISDVLNHRRPELGNSVSIQVFRVLRHVALDDMIGPGGSGIVYQAGKNIGRALELESIDDFLDWVEKSGIGIPEVENTGNCIIARVYECVTCSGLPNIGRPVCHFEGGLIAGFLERLFNKRFIAKEVKCWCLGYEVCEFEIRELKL